MNICRETNGLYNCSYCNKKYVRKSAYNNHLIKCKYATKQYKSASKPLVSETESLTLESLCRDVNIQNLFTMVIMLHNKYDKLESEYNELKKYVSVVKNKINILDYLNENFKNDFLRDGANIKNFMVMVEEFLLGLKNIVVSFIPNLVMN